MTSTSSTSVASKQEQFAALIDCVPLDSIVYAFAYGSGAISQANENAAEKMVDFILVSRDSKNFHSENVRRNPRHYSLIRLLGADNLAKLQTNFGARLYYNTNVRYNGRLLKYGVVSTDDFQTDLLDWRWMYTAGRLQKPVLDVVAPSEAIYTQITDNRRNALQAALLQLPDVFTLETLFEQIVSLSYNGDFRMLLGEDKKKISKIVKGGFEQFERLYIPLLAEDQRLFVRSHKVEQDNSTPAIYHRLNLLPVGVLDRIATRSSAWDKRQRDVEERLFSLAHRTDVGTHVSGALSSIVAVSSIRQTAKNALTAGVSKSIVYSSQKLLKMFRSIR